MTGLFETPGRIEPCLPEVLPMPITDLVAGLSAAATGLGNRFTRVPVLTLAGLVRIMNCYYSNPDKGFSRD